MGRLIVEAGTIPEANLFLYTMPAEAPFVDQAWLAQAAMYGLYEVGGHAGPFVARAVLVALSWSGLIWLSERRAGEARAVGGFALLAVVVSAGIFSIRSVLFAVPIFVAFLTVVFGVADGWLSRRWLLGLVPLSTLWANVHGSYVLLPILGGLIGGACIVEGRWRDGRWDGAQAAWWGGSLFVATLAAGFSPFGMDVYRYVWDLVVFSDVQATVTEWQPPSPTEPFGVVAIAAIVGSLVVAAFCHREVRLHEAAALLSGSLLALTAIRSSFWWAAIAVIVVPRLLAPWVHGEGRGEGGVSAAAGLVHSAILVAGVGAVVLVQPGLPGAHLRSQVLGDRIRSQPPSERLLSERNATDAVRWIARHHPERRIFHDQALGGLVEFELGAAEPDRPKRVAFVDQRMGLIPSGVWDDYFVVARGEPGWESILERWEVEVVLPDVDEQRALVDSLEASGHWRRSFDDLRHAIFVRTE